MIISVIGAGFCDNKTYGIAEDVGRLVAQKGAILIIHYEFHSNGCRHGRLWKNFYTTPLKSSQ